MSGRRRSSGSTLLADIVEVHPQNRAQQVLQVVFVFYDKPCADSSTICARRQVTTDPLPRRMIRTSRRPSSSSISRTAHARPPP